MVLDPVSALGVAAAADQFVGEGLKLVRLFFKTYTEIQEAPEDVRKNYGQVQQMISLCRLIISNPSLQTDSVASTLADCLSLVSRLQALLQKYMASNSDRKMEQARKAFMAVLKKGDIESLFQRLDRQKSTLATAVLEINSSLLNTIGIQITAVYANSGEMMVAIQDSSQHIQTMIDVVSQEVTTIYTKVPELADTLTEINDFLPTLLAQIKSNQDELLSKISRCSNRAEGTFSMPTRRNPPFMGRQKELIILKDGLSVDSRAAKCAVIRGLGGQGKSRLAMEYCQRNRDTLYKSIFWFDSASKNSTVRAFETFYNKFREPSEAQLDNNDDIVSFVRDSFERLTSPWLAVFDNYDDPSTFNVQDFIPSSKFGSILVTTRHADVLELADPGLGIALEPLAESDSIRVLLSSAAVEHVDDAIDNAKSIVKRFDNHPLAIIQAGAFIRKSKMPFDLFLDHYKANKKEILSRGLPPAVYDRRSSDDPRTLDVFATWELSFQQLGHKSGIDDHKEDLLTILGFCDDKDVSEWLLKNFCDNINPWDSPSEMAQNPGAFLADHLGRWDSKAFFDIISEFFDLSLVQDYNRRDDGLYNVSFHPLVREWIKLRIKGQDRSEYQILTYEILIESLDPSMNLASNNSFYSTSRLDGNTVQRDDETEHVAMQMKKNQLLRLLEIKQTLAALTYDTGNWAKAERSYAQILAVMERIYGSDHHETMEVCLWYGVCLLTLGNIDRAESTLRPLHDRALSLLTWKDSLLRDIRTELVNLLEWTGMFDEAEILVNDAISQDVMCYGDDHINIISGLCRLAEINYFRRNFAQTERLLKQAWAYHAFNDFKNEQWKSYCSGLDMLGKIYLFTDRQNLQEEMHENSMKIRMVHQGSMHPTTLHVSCERAAFLRATDRLLEAEDSIRDTLSKMSLVCRPDHYEYRYACALLGLCLADQGKDEEAEIYLRPMADSLDSFPFSYQQLVLDVASYCAYVLENLGKLDEAEDMAARAYAQIIIWEGTSNTSQARGFYDRLCEIQEARKAERNNVTSSPESETVSESEEVPKSSVASSPPP